SPMKKANFVVSGAFTLFALAIIFLSRSYPPSNHGVPGPRMFPLIIATLIIISSVVLFINTLRMKPEDDVPVDLTSRNVLNVYITIAGLIVYITLLPLLGFITTTSIMLLLFFKWFSRYAWWKCLLISVLFTVGIWALFSIVLNVPMRYGVLI
ncbi:MAG TPA: tripartite tricarboxylate transporter TctB family protein, partial [Sphaerochaeta sp.]|nr:tripartite tricarboxylate transporter TctB family protein [Sphaerochaeta sp.]